MTFGASPRWRSWSSGNPEHALIQDDLSQQGGQPLRTEKRSSHVTGSGIEHDIKLSRTARLGRLGLNSSLAFLGHLNLFFRI